MLSPARATSLRVLVGADLDGRVSARARGAACALQVDDATRPVAVQRSGRAAQDLDPRQQIRIDDVDLRLSVRHRERNPVEEDGQAADAERAAGAEAAHRQAQVLSEVGAIAGEQAGHSVEHLAQAGPFARAAASGSSWATETAIGSSGSGISEREPVTMMVSGAAWTGPGASAAGAGDPGWLGLLRRVGRLGRRSRVAGLSDGRPCHWQQRDNHGRHNSSDRPHHAGESSPSRSRRPGIHCLAVKASFSPFAGGNGVVRGAPRRTRSANCAPPTGRGDIFAVGVPTSGSSRPGE